MSSNKELRETKTKCRGNERVSIEAFPSGNQNEQNSRKHNFKIIEIPEEVNENM